MNAYTYLALGDSYTIGEQVPFAQNFPNQTVQQLRKTGLQMHAPEIIAKTAWTTDELQKAIEETFVLNQYDFVSLLIGVNNQYRGRNLAEFEQQFNVLLKKAIELSGDRPNRVFILSIPDWGITPFAEGKDRDKIAEEIDRFNRVCETAALDAGCYFIDITKSQRSDGQNKEFLAPDLLHPTGKEYEKWATILSTAIIKSI